MRTLLLPLAAGLGARRTDPAPDGGGPRAGNRPRRPPAKSHCSTGCFYLDAIGMLRDRLVGGRIIIGTISRHLANRIVNLIQQRRYLGSTGSTIVACSNRSEISRSQKRKCVTMPKPTSTPWWRDSNRTASGKPGAVQPSILLSPRIRLRAAGRRRRPSDVSASSMSGSIILSP